MKQAQNNKTSREKAYSDEMNDRGNEFFDSQEDTKARDRAKIEKSVSGRGQKIDSVHPDDLEQTRNDEMIEQERRDD